MFVLLELIIKYKNKVEKYLIDMSKISCIEAKSNTRPYYVENGEMKRDYGCDWFVSIYIDHIKMSVIDIELSNDQLQHLQQCFYAKQTTKLELIAIHWK